MSSKDAREIDPIGDYKSGNLLHSKVFKNESKYDNKWYTIGPLSPTQGEYSTEYFGNIFKLVCEGTAGDDGNLYQYFLSSSPTENIAIPGGNAFTRAEQGKKQGAGDQLSLEPEAIAAQLDSLRGQ